MSEKSIPYPFALFYWSLMVILACLFSPGWSYAQHINQNEKIDFSPITAEELLIPDIFPDSALPEEERKVRERLRYLESIKELLRPDEKIIGIEETPKQDVPEILEVSLENGLETIEEVLAYLRFIAFSIEDPSQTDQIINGLVQTHLSLNNPDDAIEETRRIKSNYWLIRSGNNIASYFIQEGQNTRALEVLKNNISIVRKESIEILRAPLIGKSIEQQDIEDIDALLFQTIMLLTDIGNTLDLVEGIGMISNQKARIDTVISYVTRALDNKQNHPELKEIPDFILVRSLLESFENIKNLSHSLNKDISYYVTLAKLLNGAKAKNDATGVLRYARDTVIPSLPVAERDIEWISLIEPFILTNNLADAMLSTRYINTEIDRAVGMVVLGKALGSKNDSEFAIPLLIYAADVADATRDENVKNRIIGEIIKAQSVIGRFSDAYISILKLNDVETRYKAIADMGEALLERGRYDDAYNLVSQKVPYINMRAPIMAGVAQYYAENNDPIQANRIILNSLKPPPNFNNPEAGLKSSSLKRVIAVHMKFGQERNDTVVFDAVRDLVLSTNDPFLQISTLLDLAEKQIERNRLTDASRLINTTWRIIVSNKDRDFFSRAVERMIQVQLKMQDLLNAFDAAVLLPSPKDENDIGDTRYDLKNVKYRSLNLVSKAAVDIGQVETAFRAANAIDNSEARTFALSSIPVYISERIKLNKEKFNEINQFKEQDNSDLFLDPSYIKS